MIKFSRRIQTIPKPVIQSVILNQENTTLLPVLTADLLLNNEECRYLLGAIRQQISVTQEEYKYYYLPVIHNVAEFMQQLPGTTKRTEQYSNLTLLTVTLKKTLNALKIKRGYMLPIGADTETCYRQEKQWTYAIFLAAILQECWQIKYYDVEIFDQNYRSIGQWQPLITPKLTQGYFYRWQELEKLPLKRPAYNLLLAKSHFSNTGLKWLETSNILNLLYSHLAGDINANNCITMIIQEAENKTSLKPPQLPENDSDQSSITPGSTDDYIQVANTNEQSITSNPFNSLEQSQTEEKNDIQKPEGSLPLLKNNISKLFLTWFKQRIVSQVHDIKNSIYCVNKGILISMPDLLNLFKEQVIEAKEISDKNFIKALAEDNLLILDENKKSYLHRYYKGEWKNRYIVQGILLKPEHFCTEKELISFSNELQSYLF